MRCHHVIDPKTGTSPGSVHSVTILAADGLTTEGLSKSVFVMGVEKGMRLIESQPASTRWWSTPRAHLHYSSGLLAGAPQTRQ